LDVRVRTKDNEHIDNPILEWLKFIDSKSKEGMEMIAEKNENIKTAYEILQRVSKSKEARMAYDARQAEIMDQLTREKTAKEEGIKQGIEQAVCKRFYKKARSYP
jgi:predicted transposase/invertase (TIGR01784 family)